MECVIARAGNLTFNIKSSDESTLGFECFDCIRAMSNCVALLLLANGSELNRSLNQTPLFTPTRPLPLPLLPPHFAAHTRSD
jgi:hypothetical protein